MGKQGMFATLQFIKKIKFEYLHISWEHTHVNKRIIPCDLVSTLGMWWVG
jgi:hypothetical protein